MSKSRNAFRTISEVADWLGIQAHVLRFWESKFTQVKPVKRAGGRRYYRPEDMLLLGGIKKLLHDDGLTIKGVQKVLREEGMTHVSSLSQPLGDVHVAETIDATPAPELPVAEPTEEKGVVLNFEAAKDEDALDEMALTDAAANPQAAPDAVSETKVPAGQSDNDTPAIEAMPSTSAAPTEPEHIETAQDAPAQTVPPADETPPDAAGADEDAALADQSVEIEPDTTVDETSAPAGKEDVPAQATRNAIVEASAPTEPTDQPTAAKSEDEAEDESGASLPAFLRRPMSAETMDAPGDNPPPEPDPVEDLKTVQDADGDDSDAAQSEPEATPPSPKPRVIDMPTLPAEADFTASASALAIAYRTKNLSTAQAEGVKPLLTRLSALRDAMSALHGGTGHGTKN